MDFCLQTEDFIIKYIKPYMFGDWAIRLYAMTGIVALRQMK